MIDKLKAIDFWQLTRYVVVGGLNTALSLGVYFFGLGFKAHGALVFKNRGSFLRYLLVWLAIYLGTILLIALVRDYTGDYWAPIVLLPVTTLLAYMLLNKLVFKA